MLLLRKAGYGERWRDDELLVLVMPDNVLVALLLKSCGAVRALRCPRRGKGRRRVSGGEGKVGARVTLVARGRREGRSAGDADGEGDL